VNLGGAMVSEFAYKSAQELLRLLRAKEVSPVDLAESTLRHAEALQPVLNPFVTITADLALESARQAERAIMDGREGGSLCGLPLSIKDLTAL
jgi:Asp-tRNA(Asn)/Glu-tRNA(Gln) amidotransferase A subunit family amidase